MKNKRALARLALLTATVIWGSSFVVLKNTLDSLPILLILSFRFLTAGAVLAVAFWSKLRMLNRQILIEGAIVGICVFLAYYVQTIGLNNTTPGKNAFLTSVYCILVPFIFWITDRKKPDIYNIIAALICMTGIGFVALTNDLTVVKGDYMTLIGGFFWALQIVCVAKFTKKCDAVLLTIIQFFVAGMIALIASLAVDTVPNGWFASAWKELLYMAVFCTAVTLLCQNFGQKYLPPSNAAILLSLEAVFGVLFSMLIYHEQLTLRLVIGFCLIFTATIISETKLKFTKINGGKVPK